jgi:hypothetical protein
MKSEKLNYFLFPQINDADFNYCTITKTPMGYFANTHSLSDSVFITPIDSVEMRQTIAKLDLVMQYLSSQEKNVPVKRSDTTTTGPIVYPTSYSKDRIMSEETKEKIFKETKRDARMRYDAERARQVRQGTDISGGGHLELFGTGRRKRK